MELRGGPVPTPRVRAGAGAGARVGRAARRGVLVSGLALAVVVLLARAWQIQILEGEAWTARAAEQQRQRLTLPAPRGTILDRNGIPLASTREAFQVAVAPRELRDVEEAARRLGSVLGITAAQARRAVDASRRWVVLPGRYDASVRDRLDGIQGIYFERVLVRAYPYDDLALEVLGRVAADGRALGGLELAFDEWLAGRPGLAIVRRDARGRPIPGAMLVVVEPKPGHDIVLTLDAPLQEIADDALRRAMAETGSAGGDLLFMDPRTGEVLAAASRGRGARRRWTAVTDPYEPGSTLKPFLVSALLAEGRATLQDSVYAERGRYVTGRRTITDVTGYSWLTVRDALRFSSNIAVVKLSNRLEPGEQYRYLRDFGFGTPTRLPYPSESAGVLRRPTEWTAYSRGSLAMGYEVSVTPLQMTLAYAALANGGNLMEPRVVREIRTPAGEVVKRYDTNRIRQVVAPGIARAVAEVLAEAVETGTGREAGLGVFQVAGKTGTARQVRAGRYEEGAYTASFAGFFPAVDPQLVFLVKLDRPRGAFFGGRTAAPVTRATLAAALAARSTPLDRGAMANAANGSPNGGSARRPGAASAAPARGDAAAADAGLDALPPPATPFIFALDARPAATRTAAAEVARERRVPDVHDLPMREAVARLHARGFRVEVEGQGPVRGTTPRAGTPARLDRPVRVLGREAAP